MKKNRDEKGNIGGFTLIEVLAAFVILLMSSQILLLGISYAAKMDRHVEKIERLQEEIGEHFMDKTMCIPGTVRLEIGTDEIAVEESGWLYTGGELSDGVMKIVWVEEPNDFSDGDMTQSGQTEE